MPADHLDVVGIVRVIVQRFSQHRHPLTHRLGGRVTMIPDLVLELLVAHHVWPGLHEHDEKVERQLADLDGFTAARQSTTPCIENELPEAIPSRS